MEELPAEHVPGSVKNPHSASSFLQKLRLTAGQRLFQHFYFCSLSKLCILPYACRQANSDIQNFDAETRVEKKLSGREILTSGRAAFEVSICRGARRIRLRVPGRAIVRNVGAVCLGRRFITSLGAFFVRHFSVCGLCAVQPGDKGQCGFVS